MKTRTFGDLSHAAIQSIYKIIPELSKEAGITLALAGEKSEDIAKFIFQPEQLFKLLSYLPPLEGIELARYYRSTNAFDDMYRYIIVYRQQKSYETVAQRMTEAEREEYVEEQLPASLVEEARVYTSNPFNVLNFAMLVTNIREFHGDIARLFLASHKQVSAACTDETIKANLERIRVIIASGDASMILSKGKNWELLAQRIRDLKPGYVNLTGGDWNNCNIPQCELKYALMDKLCTQDGVLEDANFEGASMVSGLFTRTNFQRANFSHVMFAGSYFDNANLTAARLDHANFANSKMKSVNMNNARGVNVDFTCAEMDSASLIESVFEGAKFFNTILVAANATRAKINAEFLGTKLDGAIFSGADLSGSAFRGVTLRFSNFYLANLSGTTYFIHGPDVHDPSPHVKSVLNHFHEQLKDHLQEQQFKDAIFSDLLKLYSRCEKPDWRQSILRIAIAHPFFGVKQPQPTGLFPSVRGIFAHRIESSYVIRLREELEKEGMVERKPMQAKVG